MGQILVVDDEKSIRITLAAFLSEADHDVQVAATAEEALDLLRKGEYDVMLTDIIMPRITGVSLLRTTRELAPHVKIIMMTGEPTVETASDSLRAGAVDYLAKPITKEKVLKIVRDALHVKALEDDKRRLEKKNREYRKKLEHLLQQSQIRFRRALENIPDVVVIYDENLRIKYINAAITRITGRPPSDFIGKREEEIWPPVFYGAYQPILTKAMHSGTIQTVETDLPLAGGEVRSLRITCVPLQDDGGRVREVLGIAQDLTDRRRYEKELRSFATYLQNEIEKDRIAISREIHDDLGPTMTALKLDITWLKRRVHADQLPMTEKMDSMLETINTSVMAIKKVCTELRPGILDDMGIVAALEWFISRFQEKTGIHCRLIVDPVDLELAADISTALFRISQEALTNVNRHAEATEVEIRLEKKSEQIYLKIEDNGKGLPGDTKKKALTFGIIGMRERVSDLSGEFSMGSRKGGGTVIEARLPVPQHESVREIIL